jgi:pathogenesis-related protein 1
MRVVHAVVAFMAVAAAACGGDDIGADDDGMNPGIDAAPVVGEPAGLEGITAAHNAERATVGTPPLVWDAQVAAIAQAWVVQCVDNDAPIGLVDHNAGRSQGYPEYVGENIYGSSGQASGTDAVASWISERANYNYQANTCNGVCGHWTQVVWSTTTKLGCAIHTCPGLQYGSTIVCDYAPGGNTGGRPY